MSCCLCLLFILFSKLVLRSVILHSSNPLLFLLFPLFFFFLSFPLFNLGSSLLSLLHPIFLLSFLYALPFLSLNFHPFLVFPFLFSKLPLRTTFLLSLSGSLSFFTYSLFYLILKLYRLLCFPLFSFLSLFWCLSHILFCKLGLRSMFFPYILIPFHSYFSLPVFFMPLPFLALNFVPFSGVSRLSFPPDSPSAHISYIFCLTVGCLSASHRYCT